MKVLILGSSGIIGQHMQEAVPAGVDAIFHRRVKKIVTEVTVVEGDLSTPDNIMRVLWSAKPDVVVNLAGESNPDLVAKGGSRCWDLNFMLPYRLAELSNSLDFRLIHVSTQAVYRGLGCPFSPNDIPQPVNVYGLQKSLADQFVCIESRIAAIVRPTFVLGVRPNPTIGRVNPVEAMLGGQKKQVNDRWFSPSFAPDVAHTIWQAALGTDDRRIIHAGVPIRKSRYEIAKNLGLDVEPVSHDDFIGLAARPIDTTYAEGDHRMSYEEGLADCLRRWNARGGVSA